MTYVLCWGFYLWHGVIAPGKWQPRHDLVENVNTATIQPNDRPAAGLSDRLTAFIYVLYY